MQDDRRDFGPVALLFSRLQFFLQLQLDAARLRIQGLFIYIKRVKFQNREDSNTGSMFLCTVNYSTVLSGL